MDSLGTISVICPWEPPTPPILPVKPLLVGVTGVRGAGKDALYKAMLATLWSSHRCKRLAFADMVKVEVAQREGFSASNWEDDAFKEAHRYLLQEHGDGMRQSDPYYWVRHVHEQLSHLRFVGEMMKCIDKPSVYVVTDVRYRNEARWIWGQGGVVVRVVRPDKEARPKTGVDAHVSETELEMIEPDYRLCNDAGLPELEERTSQMLSHFGFENMPIGQGLIG